MHPKSRGVPGQQSLRRRFADALAALPVAQWAGPVHSGFGWHLVLADQRQAPRLTAFDELREYVAREHGYPRQCSKQKIRYTGSCWRT
ncbi:MAG: peptidyl-prolyl cis-trans isomerase [Oceanospirillaceae bacterium]|nr:peptidyl-prolyl cis-trans isomerase [Oceanospirillaceae bacterium]